MDAGSIVYSMAGYLTCDRFVKAVRDALAAMGVVASKYAGHSFRIGVATTAASNGVQDSLIRTMGLWESSAYMLYIHTPKDRICTVATTLVGPPESPDCRWKLTAMAVSLADRREQHAQCD